MVRDSMTLDEVIKFTKQALEKVNPYKRVCTEFRFAVWQVKQLLVWLEDYKQLKADYADLDNRLRTANTEIDRLQSVSSWIPCSEMLPEVGEPVLIYDPYNEEMVVVPLDCDKMGFSNDDCWYGLRNVPFWMYLPNQPVSADNPCGGDDNAENFNSHN